MKRFKSKKIIFIASALCIVLLVVIWFFVRKQVSGIYRVKKENFEAIITCKGEIQS